MGKLRRVLPLVIVAVSTACGPHPGPTRDVVLVARGMSFVTENDPTTPNPVISLRAGERVRLVLKNDAPGLLHEFVIPAWKVEIEQIRAGEQREVTFAVPDVPGRVEYQCRPHSSMMKGFIDVTP